MTINLRDALLIGAVLFALIFFGLWRHASSKLDDERAKVTHYRDSATHNAQRLVQVINKHNELVASLAGERAAAAEAAKRVEQLRRELYARIAQNAALRAQLKRDDPDVQAYYDQPVPRAAADVLLHAASGQDRVP